MEKDMQVDGQNIEMKRTERILVEKARIIMNIDCKGIKISQDEEKNMIRDIKEIVNERGIDITTLQVIQDE